MGPYGDSSIDSKDKQTSTELPGVDFINQILPPSTVTTPAIDTLGNNGKLVDLPELQRRVELVDIQNPKLVSPATETQTSDAESLTKLSKVAELPVDQQNMEVLNNVATLAVDFEQSLQQVFKDLNLQLSEDDLAAVDFMRAISQAIMELKQTLQSIQLQDYKRSSELTEVKSQELDERRKRLEAIVAKHEEMRRKQEDAQKFSDVMKVLCPVIGVLAILVGAALAIFTGGASLAMAIASVAVGAALTAWSIADSVTGVTGKLVKSFDKWMKELLPDVPEYIRSLIKFVAVAIAVIAFIVIAAISGGAIAGAVAAQTVRIFLLEATRQLALQLIIMAVMYSNAVPELVVSILKDKGVSKTDQHTAEIIVLVVEMVALLAATVAGGKAPVPGSAAAATANSATAASKNVVDRLKDAFQEFQKSVAKLGEMSAGDFGRELMKMLMSFLRSLKEGAVDIKDYFAHFPKDFWEGIKETGKRFAALKDVIADTYQINFNAALQDAQRAALVASRQDNAISSGANLVTTLQLGSIVLQVAEGVIKGRAYLDIAELLKDVGELKASEEMLQQMIKFFDRLLANIQSSVDENSEFAQSLQQSIQSFYDAANQSSSQIFRPVQA